MDFWCEHVSCEALAKKEGCCAWLGRGPGKLSERRSRQRAICPEGMHSFWKVAAFRLTGSISIQSGRRAFRRRLKAVPRHVRCFQVELHHFVISNHNHPTGIPSIDQTCLFTRLTEYKSKKSDSKKVFLRVMN